MIGWMGVDNRAWYSGRRVDYTGEVVGIRKEFPKRRTLFPDSLGIELSCRAGKY